MSLRNHRGHQLCDGPQKEWIGIVEPASVFSNTSAFELISDEKIYKLVAPKNIQKLFAQHKWERFLIKGHLKLDHTIFVKAARLESDRDFEFEDLWMPFDFNVIKEQISHGFPIQPRLDEIA